jgi:PIN domain nuclease of toxin-antitoxin system
MMKLLVDTHVVIWHLEDNPRLSIEWSNTLENPAHEKYFSIASLWETAIKINVGKLKIEYPLDHLIPAEFKLLPVSVPHLLNYQPLPLHHCDPFDRILIAQTQTEGFIII